MEGGEIRALLVKSISGECVERCDSGGIMEESIVKYIKPSKGGKTNG